MELMLSYVTDHSVKKRGFGLFCFSASSCLALHCYKTSAPELLVGVCTAAQNVVHDLILKLGLTHMCSASWRGLPSFC